MNCFMNCMLAIEKNCINIIIISMTIMHIKHTLIHLKLFPFAVVLGSHRCTRFDVNDIKCNGENLVLYILNKLYFRTAAKIKFLKCHFAPPPPPPPPPPPKKKQLPDLF